MWKRVVLLIVVCSVLTSPAWSQDEWDSDYRMSRSQVEKKFDPFVFPKDGQTKEQVAEDKSTCRNWAEDETGINPALAHARLEQIKNKQLEDEGRMGGLFKGVLKGAASGALVGVLDKNIDDEVGRDASKGAVLGGILTHEKQNDKADARELRRDDWTKDEIQESIARYQRAFRVCMEAKGYAVE